jgi:two-component system LytT family sensor kinase
LLSIENGAMKTKKAYRTILILLGEMLFLGLLGNLLGLFTIPWEVWSLKVVFTNSIFSIAIGFPAFKGMGWFTKTLDRRIPWLKSPIKRLIYQVVGLILLSGMFIFIGFAIWHRAIGGHSLKGLLMEVRPTLKVVYTFMFLSVLLGNTIVFFVNWKKATIQQEELKRAHLALQFQSLKDQIRPHFLFNSLSSLATLINTDTDRATLFVEKLSDVYRYVLEQKDNELLPLKDELKFLEDYIFLQKIRFGDKLHIKNSLDPNLKRLVIPLSLQMLVENAIKHNEISEEKPLLIELSSTDKLQVIVKNKLQKKEVSEASLGMGLENLKKQIDFFSDESMEIQEEGGSFMVTIPTFST